jgi:hypothetical protein
MLRNKAAGTKFPLSSSGELQVGVADVQETIRRDIIDSVSTNVTSTERIVDELGVEYTKGEGFDWAGVIDTSKAYVEWCARYTSLNNITGIELIGLSKTITAVVQPITVLDGSLSLTFTFTGTLLTLNGYVAGAVNVSLLTAGDYAVLAGSASTQIIIRRTTAALPGSDKADTVTMTTAGPRSGSTGGVGTLPSYPSDGSTRYILYYHKLKTTADLVPAHFDTVTDIQNFHGALSASTPADHLSLGCIPYFNNGGSTVYCMPLHDNVIDPSYGYDLATESGYVSAMEEALTRLEEVNEVTTIVPLKPTEVSATRGNYYSGILQKCKAHVLKMNSLLNNAPRVAFLGARANTTTEETFQESQQACGSEDMFYVTPATETLTTGGFTYTLSGANLAAAISGLWANPSYNAGEPISSKPIVGFDSVTDPFTRLQKNRIGEQYGGTVVETKNGAIQVRHFLTTRVGNPLYAEGKVARIRVDIRRTLKSALDATIINTRLTPSTLTTARSIVELLLNQKITDQVLNDGKVTRIAINSLEPRQIDIDVKVIPVFDANWIQVNATFAIS